MLDNNILSPGIYYLSINYSTAIRKSSDYGVHFMVYNRETWLISTEFEPVYARRLLPCFDEPNFKATFDLSITHNSTYKALSNMPIKQIYQNKSSSMATTIFKKTPPMSTYLLAFVVSNYTNSSNEYKNVTVHAPASIIQHTNLAIKTTEQILKEMEMYTGVAYQLNKLDEISILNSNGAMENWGLIVYNHKQLIFDDVNHGEKIKQANAIIIAHEVVHQWFGNLVTPKWWKHLWLSEGLATYFSYYGIDKIEPKWRTMDQFVVEKMESVFNKDSLQFSHSICKDVETPKEIESMFDSITYDKGAAITRMLQHIITEPVFQKGIQNYFKKFHYKSANTNDFYQAIQEAVDSSKINFPVKTVMDTWMKYEGYPILTVTRNYNNKSMIIEQKRFYTNNYHFNKKMKQLYYVPINYVSQDKLDFENTIPEYWLFNTTLELDIDIEPNNWIILNKQRTGFYRVNYDENNWKLIINYLLSKNYTNIHPLNRIQLINDALVFVQQDLLNVKTFLHLINYLKQENDPVVWHAGFKSFSWLNERLQNTKHYSIFTDFMLGVIRPLITKIGYEDKTEDTHLTKLLREMVLNWACYLGDDNCLNNMHERLMNWLNDPQNNTISKDLKEVVLCNGLRKADNNTLQKLLEIKTANHIDEFEKDLLGRVLGCSSNRKILKFYLEQFIMTYYDFDIEQFIMPYYDFDLDDVIEFLYQSNVGIEVILDILVHSLSSEYIDENKDMIIIILEKFGNKITTMSQLNKLRTSIYQNKLPYIIKKIVLQAEKNIEWLNNNGELITNTIKEIQST